MERSNPPWHGGEILPAQFVGTAHTHGWRRARPLHRSRARRSLDIGGVKVNVSDWAEEVGVYVRRHSSDGSVAEIAMARHDGLEREEHAHTGPLVDTVLPAEFVGMAEVARYHLDRGGVDVQHGYWAHNEGDANDTFQLDIGGVKVQLDYWAHVGVAVYVRRDRRDRSVVEIVMVDHLGLDYEELGLDQDEAESSPLGPKEYCRKELVGGQPYGRAPMTGEEFESWWADHDTSDPFDD